MVGTSAAFDSLAIQPRHRECANSRTRGNLCNDLWQSVWPSVERGLDEGTGETRELPSTHSGTIPASRYTQYTANGSTLPSRIRLKFVRIPVITLNESTMASMVAKSFMGSAVASSAPKVFHASASLHCVVRPRRNACLSARGADHGMQAASFRHLIIP